MMQHRGALMLDLFLTHQIRHFHIFIPETTKGANLQTLWPLRDAKPQIMSDRWGSLILGLHMSPRCLPSASFSPSLPASRCSQLGELVLEGPSTCSTPQSISSTKQEANVEGRRAFNTSTVIITLVMNIFMWNLFKDDLYCKNPSSQQQFTDQKLQHIQ